MTEEILWGYFAWPVASVHDYLRRGLDEATLAQIPPEFRAPLEATWAKLEAEYLSFFQSGDEWFAWQHMTHPLSGSGGLELRRGGERVKRWMSWVA